MLDRMSDFMFDRMSRSNVRICHGGDPSTCRNYFSLLFTFSIEICTFLLPCLDCSFEICTFLCFFSSEISTFSFIVFYFLLKSFLPHFLFELKSLLSQSSLVFPIANFTFGAFFVIFPLSLPFSLLVYLKPFLSERVLMGM